MLPLYSNIRKHRELLGLSQSELAKKVGYTDRTSIAKIETGKVDLPQSKIVTFANALDTTPGELMGWEENTIGDLPTYDNILPIEIKRYPLLGEIACGIPKFTNQDYESYVECGADIKADFALRCVGDSMINARIYDGDIVFIREQPTVENGDIAAVIIDDTATLKRFKQFDNMVILSPENHNYDDIVIRLDETTNIRILGKAIAFQSNII